MGDVKVLGAGVQRFRKPWVKFSFVDLLREKKQIETIIFFHLFFEAQRRFLRWPGLATVRSGRGRRCRGIFGCGPCA